MIDLSGTIKPKSDQLNADDLIAGPITVTIEAVQLADSSEQPIVVWIGEQYQPYKPCKSMRRLLIAVWGRNDTDWVGKSMTLFNDPSVKWAGQAVGGIRISHVSGITKQFSVALTATKGKRTPYVVQPLKVQQNAPAAMSKQAVEWLASFEKYAQTGCDALTGAFKSAPESVQKELAGEKRRLWSIAQGVDQQKAQNVAAAPVDDVVNPASVQKEPEEVPTTEEFDPEKF